jgi:outer membrane protein OmpA-like peptidoglycan-associated protein
VKIASPALALVCTALSASACATTQPPRELIQAREAYSRAERSDAAEYDPAALHEAKQALNRAESLFEEDGDEPRVSDAAYVATRRAERAKVDGETVHLRQQKDELQHKAEQARAKAASDVEKQLSSTREQLEAERAAREAAEASADQAMAKLRQTESQSMKEEQGRTVITVAGAFLFGSGKAQLQPASYPKLEKIADALEQQGTRMILIEGYTDSTGSDAVNMELSKQRADAVADYLASRGVPRDKLRTAGRGSANPIAPNNTPEGRAQNRRVEITVQHPQQR